MSICGWSDRSVQVLLALLLLPSSTGCLERELAPLHPCTVSVVKEELDLDPIEQIDLLFVVDNSGSMVEEQTALALEIPRMIQVLTSGDKDGNGTQDFRPAKSIQVGVVSTDMGTGGVSIPTCVDPNFGDDGLLQETSAVAGCAASYPRILAYDEVGAIPGSYVDPDAFAHDVSCVAQLGALGCGIEQPLEAALKALTPADSDLRFFMDTAGHGGDANRGFVRDDSILAVIILSDEDDCSAQDPAAFDRSSSVYRTQLNVRCAFEAERALHATRRYVDGLLALKDKPDHLVYAAIAGVPTDLTREADSVDYTRILDDDRMQFSPQDGSSIFEAEALATSCNVAGRGLAYPPRRLVEVARILEEESGSNGVVQSICQGDFRPALAAILEKIIINLDQQCIPRPLERDDNGQVPCHVMETLPTEGEFTRCDQLPGREALFIDSETGAEVCQVQQISFTGGVVPSGSGWYYDDFTDEVAARCGERPRIAFAVGSEPKKGLIRLECLQPVPSEDGSTLSIPTCAD